MIMDREEEHSGKERDLSQQSHQSYDEKSIKQASISSEPSTHSNHDRQDTTLPQTQPNNEIGDEKVGNTLEPAQSKHASVRDASSIPNGGLWAWLQVLGGFFLLFNSWYVQLSKILPSDPNII